MLVKHNSHRLPAIYIYTIKYISFVIDVVRCACVEVYVFSHLFYHPSPLLSGMVYQLWLSAYDNGSISGRVYKMYLYFYECVCSSFSRYLLYAFFFDLTFYQIFSIPCTHSRAHTFLFFSFCLFLGNFRISYLAIQLEVYERMWSVYVFVFSCLDCIGKCNYRDFHRKMRGNREMEEKETGKTSLKLNNEDYGKMTCEKEFVRMYFLFVYEFV